MFRVKKLEGRPGVWGVAGATGAHAPKFFSSRFGEPPPTPPPPDRIDVAEGLSALSRGSQESGKPALGNGACGRRTRVLSVWRSKWGVLIERRYAQLNVRKTPTTRNAYSPLKTKDVFRFENATTFCKENSSVRHHRRAPANIAWHRRQRSRHESCAAYDSRESRCSR